LFNYYGSRTITSLTSNVKISMKKSKGQYIRGMIYILVIQLKSF